MKIKSSFIVLVLFVSFVKLSAQVKVVPFCPSKKISVYTGKMEKKYHLFPEYHEIVSAELHQQPDSTYLIEIIYKDKGKFYMVNQSVSDSILEIYREKIKRGNVNVSIDTTYQDINARLRFNLGGATYSFLGYSWMMPVMLNIKDPKVFVGMGLVSSSVGFFIPMVLTKNVTPSEAVLKNYGQFKGFGDGLLFYSLLDIGFEYTNRAFLSSLSFSVVEGTAGYFLGRFGNFSYLNALTTRNYSFYGYYWGGTLGSFFSSDDLSGVRIPMLLSNFAGGVGGYYLSKNFNFTRGDNRIVFGTTLLGASWATAISLFNNFNDDYVVKPSYFIASTAGIGVGTLLGIKHNITATQSVIVNLSSVGAGLIAGGIAGIATDESMGFLVGSAIGTATFIGIYSYTLKKQSVQISLNNRFDNFNFSVNPAVYFMKKNNFIDIAGMNNPLSYNPLFTLSYKF